MFLGLTVIFLAFFQLLVVQSNGHISRYASEPGKILTMMEFDPAIGEVLNARYWQQQAVETLRKRFKQLAHAGFSKRDKNRPARNIILFIGDGLGVSGVTAARKFKEEYTRKEFYESELVWDAFPFTGFSKTYQVDNVVADSAGTATAYLSGVKTRFGFIGLDATGDPECNSTKGYVDSIASWAQKMGKVAGMVTTTTITHASPSPLYAHLPAPLRNFEYHGAKNFTTSHPKCDDIAKQFVRNGQHLKVAMGGGRAYFSPSDKVPQGEDKKRGLRKDGLDLIEEWTSDRSKGAKKTKYVTARDELKSLDPTKVDYLLGLFSYDYMGFVDDEPPKSEPSLTEMVTAAIKVLDQNKDGYFLFVEGGRIDHGHHLGSARYALTETIEFDNAIKAALELVDLSETLIVVSADHSHTLTISGFLGQKSSILGLSANLGSDGKTYTSLAYANGPGFNLTGPHAPYTGSRRNDSIYDVLSTGYLQTAAVPTHMEWHGGEDVPVYATGVYSELFTGVYEQSYITWAMACAAGIYPPAAGASNKQMASLCPKPLRESMSATDGASSNFGGQAGLVVLWAVYLALLHRFF